jgi:TRAP-type C4-dicarboxylate transport system permease small subunit
MELLRRAVDAIDRLSNWLATALSLIILAVTLDGVFFRFVLNSSLQWSDEVAVWGMVWMVWIGAISVMRQWDHVHIPVFLRMLPVPARMVFVPLAKVITLLCLAIVLWHGVEVFQGTFHIHSPSTGLSTKWVKLAIPVGAALMALCLVFLISEDIRRILRKEWKYFEDYGAMELPGETHK